MGFICDLPARLDVGRGGAFVIWYFHLFNIATDRFKIAAKLTHKIYGIIKYMAKREMGRNLRMVHKITSHKTTISAKAHHSACQWKKTSDQRKLSAN